MLTYKNISPTAVPCKQVLVLNSPVIYRCLGYTREKAQMALVSTIEGLGRRLQKTGKLLSMS